MNLFQDNKQCSDYNIETECEAATNIGQNKKCSWDKSKYIKCKEYTIDSHCTVTSGECKSGSSPPTGNNECLFGLEAGHTSECISREKICSNYNKDCETKVQITNTKQCISNGNVCQEISVDETCKIDNNECKFREATTEEKVGKCDYINVIDCKLRTRRCDEFSDVIQWIIVILVLKIANAIQLKLLVVLMIVMANVLVKEL